MNGFAQTLGAGAAVPRTPDWRLRSRWHSEHWRIGLIDAPLHALLADTPLPAIHWLTAPERDGYWADPFGLPGDAETVYCERFDERTGLGRLERLVLRGNALQPLGPVVSLGTDGRPEPVGSGLHASFPHVFELDGERYAVAETGAARRCVLYRVDGAGRWHARFTLLDGIAAADPALFRHDGRFWLAYTDVDRGVHDNLCLAHAERLEGPWAPHPGNPVKVDRGSARMAGGFFEHRGQWYRPGQDCRSTYGAALVLHRVDECSPRAYRETAVRVLAPDPNGPLPHGLHTASAWGDRTLVDGKRMVVNPLALARRLARRLGVRR